MINEMLKIYLKIDELKTEITMYRLLYRERNVQTQLSDSESAICLRNTKSNDTTILKCKLNKPIDSRLNKILKFSTTTNQSLKFTCKSCKQSQNWKHFSVVIICSYKASFTWSLQLQDHIMESHSKRIRECSLILPCICGLVSSWSLD